MAPTILGRLMYRTIHTKTFRLPTMPLFPNYLHCLLFDAYCLAPVIRGTFFGVKSMVQSRDKLHVTIRRQKRTAHLLPTVPKSILRHPPHNLHLLLTHFPSLCNLSCTEPVLVNHDLHSSRLSIHFLFGMRFFLRSLGSFFFFCKIHIRTGSAASSNVFGLI